MHSSISRRPFVLKRSFGIIGLRVRGWQRGCIAKMLMIHRFTNNMNIMVAVIQNKLIVFNFFSKLSSLIYCYRCIIGLWTKIFLNERTVVILMVNAFGYFFNSLRSVTKQYVNIFFLNRLIVYDIDRKVYRLRQK